MNSKIFSEVAIYVCACCGHKNEFLSIKKWAEIVKGECKECCKSDVALFEPSVKSFKIHLLHDNTQWSGR